MKLTFLGATGTVTGSKYLLEHAGKKVLIDCGLFQGLKDLRLRNWEKLPVDPASIEAVLLTHAHIDHSGYIPLLVKNGFQGTIFCSEATFDLCNILLPDSGYLQEADAERCNRYGYSKHQPALPLYTQKDAEQSLKQFKAVDFGKTYSLYEDLSFSLSRSGHILGASFIQIYGGKQSILFSGDLGRPDDPVMKPPVQIQQADYLVIESTYGNRRHRNSNPQEEIGVVIRNTVGRGGSVIIPSFAVGRAQSMLYYIYQLKKQKVIADIPVFLDSPMAINATKILFQHKNDHRLSGKLCEEVCRVAKYIHTPQESKQLDQNNELPAIIISASGMATGGRILHHLKHFLGDERNTILFTGFQAAGTRGERLLRGEKEIKIHGQMWPVLAQVAVLHNTSAHADYGEILDWLGHFKASPCKTFITHGEPEASAALKIKIDNQLDWETEVPSYMQTVTL